MKIYRLGSSNVLTSFFYSLSLELITLTKRCPFSSHFFLSNQPMNCQSQKLSIQIQLNALLLGALAFPIQIYHYRRFIYKRNWNACILSISIIFRCRECSNCILPFGLDFCKFKVKRKKNVRNKIVQNFDFHIITYRKCLSRVDGFSLLDDLLFPQCGHVKSLHQIIITIFFTT